MTDISRTPPDVAPTRSSPRFTHELQGAVALVRAGHAVRVVLCGVSGRDAVAALGEVTDLTDVVPIRTEHDGGDVYSVIIGPVRS